MSVMVDIRLETFTKGSAQLRNGQHLGTLKPAEPDLSHFVLGHMASYCPRFIVLAEMLALERVLYVLNAICRF